MIPSINFLLTKTDISCFWSHQIHMKILHFRITNQKIIKIIKYAHICTWFCELCKNVCFWYNNTMMTESWVSFLLNSREHCFFDNRSWFLMFFLLGTFTTNNKNPFGNIFMNREKSPEIFKKIFVKTYTHLTLHSHNKHMKNVTSSPKIWKCFSFFVLFQFILIFIHFLLSWFDFIVFVYGKKRKIGSMKYLTNQIIISIFVFFQFFLWFYLEIFCSTWKQHL